LVWWPEKPKSSTKEEIDLEEPLHHDRQFVLEVCAVLVGKELLEAARLTGRAGRRRPRTSIDRPTARHRQAGKKTTSPRSMKRQLARLLMRLGLMEGLKAKSNDSSVISRPLTGPPEADDSPADSHLELIGEEHGEEREHTKGCWLLLLEKPCRIDEQAVVLGHLTVAPERAWGE